jgi:hypothetical protein
VLTVLDMFFIAAGSRKQLRVVAAGKGGLLDNPTITTPTYEKG